jgi:hypothetical protein
VGQQKDLKAVEEKAWSLGVLNHYTFDAPGHQGQRPLHGDVSSEQQHQQAPHR